MSLSQLARSICESPTLKLNETAALLREKGEPVIHLGGGEPKTKAPIDAVVSCASLLHTGEVRYTPPDGIAPLKKAVLRYMEEHYGRLGAPENVIVSSGAKQAIMVLLHAILDPKEEVIFPAPYWVSYPEMVKLAGGVPVPVVPRDGTFCPTVEEVIEAVGPYTKAIMLNSPNNPSGVVYPAEFIAGVVEFCEKRGLWLIMDDTYNRLIFDGRQPTNCYDFAHDPLENSKLVVINCVSKMYAMTGFRIGWALGNRAVHPGDDEYPVAADVGTGRAFAMGSGWRAQRRAVFDRRPAADARKQPQHYGGPAARLRGVRVTKPGGTFYCFPDFSAYEKDSQKLARMLLEKVRVVTVPGREFGMEGHLRLSFCGTVKEVTEGIERIKWALDPGAPNELFLGDRKLVRDWR